MSNETAALLATFVCAPTTMKPACLLRLSLVLLTLVMLPSCGSQFRQAWKQSPDSNGVAGKWQGTWLSDANGHHGTLRCVVSGPANQQGDHEFFYRATWKSILSGSYKSMHTVKKQGDGHTFKGEHQMPDWAGGLYHYSGTIKGDDFHATYKSTMDHGSFTMKRVH